MSRTKTGKGTMPLSMKSEEESVCSESLSKCKDYNSVSLLNVVLKIFTKWLTTRLNKSITTIVNQDQGSFMPSREAADNLRRVLQIL